MTHLQQVTLLTAGTKMMDLEGVFRSVAKEVSPSEMDELYIVSGLVIAAMKKLNILCSQPANDIEVTEPVNN